MLFTRFVNCVSNCNEAECVTTLSTSCLSLRLGNQIASKSKLSDSSHLYDLKRVSSHFDNNRASALLLLNAILWEAFYEALLNPNRIYGGGTRKDEGRQELGAKKTNKQRSRETASGESQNFAKPTCDAKWSANRLRRLTRCNGKINTQSKGDGSAWRACRGSGQKGGVTVGSAQMAINVD